jgi:predicted SAM-dependent methyltransferase
MKTMSDIYFWEWILGRYSKTQRWYSEIIRNSNFQMNKLDTNTKTYLNVGCGPNIHPKFINLDYYWRPNMEICWDITKRLPFSSNDIKGIFSEHCLEHITYSQCFSVLKEFHRILTSNGVIRIIVPDGELYLDLYQKEKLGESVDFPYIGEVGKKHLEEDSRLGFTPMMAVNRIFRGYGHLFAYDGKTLEAMLKQAGFINICKEGFMKGRDMNLLIDSEERRPQSLYIEGTKP